MSAQPPDTQITELAAMERSWRHAAKWTEKDHGGKWQWPTHLGECRLRNVNFEADFLVFRISDDAILEMEFFRRRDCTVACNKGLLVMADQDLQCTDIMGRLLANKV